MSNLNLFVAGRIYQGSERFSDISRGRQCSIICSEPQTFPIEQWTASINVDLILAEGDRLLYLDAFESRSIPDTETLSLDYHLSGEMRWSLDANTMQIYNRHTNDSLHLKTNPPPCRWPLLLGIFTPLEYKTLCVIDPSGSAFLNFNPSGNGIFSHFPQLPVWKNANYPLGNRGPRQGGRFGLNVIAQYRCLQLRMNGRR
jgi:hypothetical protein